MATLYWIYDLDAPGAQESATYDGNWMGRGAIPGGGWTRVQPELMPENEPLQRYGPAIGSMNGAPVDRYVITGPAGSDDPTQTLVPHHTMTISRDVSLRGELV